MYAGPRNHSALWLLITVRYTNILTYLVTQDMIQQQLNKVRPTYWQWHQSDSLAEEMTTKNANYRSSASRSVNSFSRPDTDARMSTDGRTTRKYNASGQSMSGGIKINKSKTSLTLKDPVHVLVGEAVLRDWEVSVKSSCESRLAQVFCMQFRIKVYYKPLFI